jgi:cysteine desulfurase
MLPWLNDEWGNASSSHRFGAKLKGGIEIARAQVAALMGAPPRDVIFTSCPTERPEICFAWCDSPRFFPTQRC